MIRLAVLIIGILACGCAATSASPTSAQARPNILWISAEDICPDLGCYGDTYARTPNLDRLASQGVRFNLAFATAPVCSPSRSSIITGMYASSIGTHNHRSNVVLPAQVKCFTEYLRAAGYYCTNNAKTDYNFTPPPTAWDQSSNAAHWRNRPDKSQPFFAVFNFNETHESRVINKDGQFDRLTASLPPQQRHDPAKAILPPYYPDTPIFRAMWARYYDLIGVMDQRIQKLLDELQKDGLADNTIVVFWGDHGRCLPRGKRWAYDSGLHVPLIVRWPGHIQPDSVRDDLVTLMDLGPTMLSIAGAEIPKHLQGRPILGPHPSPAPQYVFATRDRMDETTDMIRSARDSRYRYIRNFHPELPYAQSIKYMDQLTAMHEWRQLAATGGLTGPPSRFFAPTKPKEELYDLIDDPHEIHNLASSPQHQQLLQRMRAALEQWMLDIRDHELKTPATGG